MRIEVVTIGDELLLGFTIDTNAAHLARTCAAHGIQVVRRATVGDGAEQIASAVREALDRTGAVVTTGGLGPTSDDLTKPAIAALFGRTMELDEQHLAWMAERWRTRFGRELPASNRAQAMIPSGAHVLRNNHGSAPGIWLEDDRGRWVAMLPGVPREMRGMLGDTLLPRLVARMESAGTPATVIASRTLRTTGVAESLLADRIVSAGAAPRTVDLAYLPGMDGVDLRITVRGLPGAAADRALEEAAARLRGVLGDDVYSETDQDLAEVVLQQCRSRGLTVAVAESCTGGLLGARLTAIAGSSDVVLGGFIAYANSVKQELVGVAESDIVQHGAVSEPVVRALAAGARERTGASIGLGITGVAGPGGGTAEKPVGTVWVAAATSERVEARRLQLWGDRAEVRHRSAQAALDLLRRQVLPRALPGR